MTIITTIYIYIDQEARQIRLLFVLVLAHTAHTHEQKKNRRDNTT